LPALVDPATARDYVYVEDVIDAYLLAAEHHGSELGAIFNVGSGVQTSLREVVAIARHVLGISTTPVWGSMPGRVWDSNVWLSDIGKIQKELGWSPRYSLESGFRATADWIRSQPSIAQWYRNSCISMHGGDAAAAQTTAGGKD
jgi:nucleoside-diphosphate-sugar epimerase